MAEYISRQDAIEVINQGRLTKLIDADVAESGLKNLPASDVVPMVHSQWKYKCGEIQCPECGNRIYRIDLSGYLNFCPNCGAKMDGKE